MLILLDIDGVMLPAKGWKSPELLNDGFPAFGAKAVSALNSLINKHTKIMLTTSHKSNFTIDGWKDIFKNRNIHVENLDCLPPNKNHLTRKEEILNWFTTNNVVEEFIIIDDDKSLNELPSFLKVNLVQTSSYIGLTEEHIQIINALLRRNLRAV